MEHIGTRDGVFIRLLGGIFREASNTFSNLIPHMLIFDETSSTLGGKLVCFAVNTVWHLHVLRPFLTIHNGT
eukprot:4018699-Amphidinium_carterae.1